MAVMVDCLALFTLSVWLKLEWDVQLEFSKCLSNNLNFTGISWHPTIPLPGSDEVIGVDTEIDLLVRFIRKMRERRAGCVTR
jgi:hypothetical protein